MSNVNLLALQKQAIGSPEVLLDHALPLIVTGLDAVISAEAFRLTRGGLVVWHVENSTRESAARLRRFQGRIHLRRSCIHLSNTAGALDRPHRLRAAGRERGRS